MTRSRSLSSRLQMFPALLRTRVRQGRARVKTAILPALQMTICAVSAVTCSMLLFGHVQPIFAATTSLVALGFGVSSTLSRVMEVGMGCTLGIAVGDALRHLLGAGIWQSAVVLMACILLSRFLSPSPLITTQMGVQSLLVVLLPLNGQQPFSRSLDAAVGGLFALILVALWPQDPRRLSHSGLRTTLQELAAIVRECAGALAYADSRMAWHALVRARKFQSLLDKTRLATQQAEGISQISPFYQRHRAEIRQMKKSLEYVDLAARNMRVFARRLSSVIDNAALSTNAQSNFSHQLELTAEAIEALAHSAGETKAQARDRYRRRSIQELTYVAGHLSPKTMDIQLIEGEALLLLMRPLLVDLLESAGVSPEDAREVLPALEVPEDAFPETEAMLALPQAVAAVEHTPLPEQSRGNRPSASPPPSGGGAGDESDYLSKER